MTTLSNSEFLATPEFTPPLKPSRCHKKLFSAAAHDKIAKMMCVWREFFSQFNHEWRYRAHKKLFRWKSDFDCVVCGRNIKIKLLAFNKRLRSSLWTEIEAQTAALRRIGCHQSLVLLPKRDSLNDKSFLKWENCSLLSKFWCRYRPIPNLETRISQFNRKSQPKKIFFISSISDDMLRWQRPTFLKFCCCIIHRALYVVIWFLLCWFDSEINLASTVMKATTMFRKSSRLD